MSSPKIDIDHIAHLARIDLKTDEKIKISNDLDNILGYIELLNELDVSNVKPLVNIVDKATPLRKDEITPSLSQEEALKNAPEKNSDYFKVPKVLNQ